MKRLVSPWFQVVESSSWFGWNKENSSGPWVFSISWEVPKPSKAYCSHDFGFMSFHFSVCSGSGYILKLRDVQVQTLCSTRCAFRKRACM